MAGCGEAVEKTLSQLQFSKSKTGGLRVNGGNLPCGHQLALWNTMALQRLEGRIAELERITLPTDSEADLPLDYEPFEPAEEETQVPEAAKEPEPKVETLSAETLSQLDALQKELDAAVVKKSEIEQDDLESISSDGQSVCTEQAHKLIREKAQREHLLSKDGEKGVGSWLLPGDDCKGCLKGKAKKLKAERKEEKRAIKAEKKRIRNAKTQEEQQKIKRITERMMALRLG